MELAADAVAGMGGRRDRDICGCIASPRGGQPYFRCGDAGDGVRGARRDAAVCQRLAEPGGVLSSVGQHEGEPRLKIGQLGVQFAKKVQERGAVRGIEIRQQGLFALECQRLDVFE